MAIATYCTVGFASIGFNELLTIWMATKRFRGDRDIDVCLSMLTLIILFIF